MSAAADGGGAHVRVEVVVLAGRPVVTKRALDVVGRAQLRQELARLDAAAHPGVVDVLARTDGAHTGFALAWAGTTTFETWSGPPARVAALVAQVAAAIADLHARGLVHGHLRAEHVIVGPDGRARLCGLGHESQEDPAGDVAAIGRLLHRLLPFGSTEEPIPDRRWRLLPAWRHQLVAPLLTLADQATDPDPHRRPTARELADALIELAEGDQRHAVSRRRRAHEPSRRALGRRAGAWPLAPGAVLLGAVLLGAARRGPWPSAPWTAVMLGAVVGGVALGAPRAASWLRSKAQATQHTAAGRDGRPAHWRHLRTAALSCSALLAVVSARSHHGGTAGPVSQAQGRDTDRPPGPTPRPIEHHPMPATTVDAPPAQSTSAQTTSAQTTSTQGPRAKPERDPTPVGTPDDAGRNPSEWLVHPGDHLWSIARRVVAGATPSLVDDAEVARYWRQLIAANPQVEDPDLIWPGQRIALPPR